MNSIKSLYDFIRTATAERKYADNTARGLKAALKLFETHLNDSEKESLDTLEKNLDNITKDIFAKQKDDKFKSKTLTIYQQRVVKVIADYRLYGSDPGKMAAWNPRRSTTALKLTVKPTISKSSNQAVQEAQIIEVEESRRSPMLKLADTLAAHPQGGGVTGFDVAGRYIDTNRSEIFLRDGFKTILELPVDLTTDEAAKLKQYIDLMAMQ
jgi:hypothetical protein